MRYRAKRIGKYTDDYNCQSQYYTPETGCPWDLEQDFKSIAPYTIEEACEVADAIERDDMEDLRLELGDLLLQSVYHSQGMAEGTWERIKAEEKAEAASLRASKGLPAKNENNSILDDVPNALPALACAVKLQKKASKVGFDWNDPHAVIAKIREELDEFEAELKDENTEKQSEELGDIFFALANLARHQKIDPDSALRSTNQKFRNRFSYIETHIERENETMESASLEIMDALWNEAKTKLPGSSSSIDFKSSE